MTSSGLATTVPRAPLGKAGARSVVLALSTLVACQHDWDALEPTGETAPPSGEGGEGGLAAAGGAGASSGSAASSGSTSSSSSGGGSGSAGGGGAGTTASGGAGGVGTGASGGLGGSGGAPLGNGACPSGLPGPALVRVPVVGGGAFCIDATEVTNAQYAAWLESDPDLTDQPPYCSGNATFEPSAFWPVVGFDDYPVTSVDWCDARGYCAQAGKRLCGALGGGPTDFDAYADATTDMWFYACSNAGVHTYPYGDVYGSQTCNGFDHIASITVVAVGFAFACEGGFPGIFDMSGNAWEWQDACAAESSGADSCRLRGGSYKESASSLVCATPWAAPRSDTSIFVGFRCCADALP